MLQKTVVVLVLLIGIAAFAPKPGISALPDRATYAAQCAAEMGKIPGFNCLDDTLLA